ncbi:hypothetical protein HMPREF1624_07464 [Sporothrix schenckii ATCC 58251]|uniref:Zn(2)-C6 fungal-type domain-containing protein n=1 Tax=Sporothrix schenckii (strain ATCC 58251 / de Perez 2211183) TaxID=1391915 RepID=U7PN68_SPOS1|nr:hypothetical protein HMPREF1624_07464 [Sporothrix schenckii ATCC 58251]
MDHGPETKKVRLSTAGSSWASSSGPSSLNALPPSSSPSSHLYQHHQHPYTPGAAAHSSHPNAYAAAAAPPPHHPYHQPHPPRLPSPRTLSPRLPSPRHSPRYTLQHPQPPPQPPSQLHPVHSSASPYQSAYPSASSAPAGPGPGPGPFHTNGSVASASTSASASAPASASASAALDQRPSIASSPAPATPVSAHSFTNSTTLPPPLPAPHNQHNGTNTNGRLLQHKPSHSHSLSQPRTYSPHLDDRRHNEQDTYALGQDHRPQDFYPQQQQQQQHQQQYLQQPPDYRFPSRSPASAAPGLPPPPHNAPSYDRADKPQHLQHPQLVDDDPARNRPGSAASTTGTGRLQQQQQQQQPPMPPMRQSDDGARSMSFDNLSRPNMGGPGQPPQSYPPPYPAQQQQQQQQPPPPTQPQVHHLPPQHQQHPPPQHAHYQPYSQQPAPPPLPAHHPPGHMQSAAPSQQQSPSGPPQGSQQDHSPQYRPSSYPPATTPASMSHAQPPPPPIQQQPLMPLQHHPHGPPPLQPQQPSPTQQPPPPQPHPLQHPQQSPQQQQQMSHPAPPAPPSAPPAAQQQQPPQLQPHYEQQPPPPAQQQTPMFSHASGPPPSADILYPLAYAAAGKKKAQRASQACDSCRSLKAKCDETKPCKNCREKNIECKYRDPIPKQQDKATADLIDSIGVMRNDIQDIMAAVQQLAKSAADNAQATAAAAAAAAATASALEAAGVGVNLRGAGIASSADAMQAAAAGASILPIDPANANAMAAAPAAPAPLSSNEAERITRETQGELNAVSDFTGPVVKPNESAIPSNHTTLAGLLLTWPSIRERVHHLLVEQGIQHLPEYPIRQEEQRGTIRFMGRGEGFDQKMTIRVSENEAGSSLPETSVAMERGPSTVSNNSSGGSYEDGKESVRFPGEMWGQLGGWGQVGPYGASSNIELDLDPKTVWAYVKSYEANIQNMHPIINPKPLYAMVTLFLETLPRSSSSSSQAGRSAWGAVPRAPVAAFAGTPDEPQAQSPTAEGSLKRKRSPFPEGYSGPSGSGIGTGTGTGTGGAPVAPRLPLRPGVPFRNAESALVLAILALGKICLHKQGHLPDVVPENLDPESPLPTGAQSSQASPVFAEAHIHTYNAQPNNGYSPAPSVHDSPSASPAVGPGHTPSRRTSVQGGGGSQSFGSSGTVPWAPVSGGGASAGSGNFLPPSSSGTGSAKGGNSGNSGGLPSAASMRRNVDEIPGLDYFAAAMEIIGCHGAGRELKHVWVYIVACLYYGQLGRPIESLEAVATAGRLLLGIVRPSMHRFKSILTKLEEYAGKMDEFGKPLQPPDEKNVQHRDNPFLLAFWSCLQLESDILAELHLPPSGILQYEKHFPYPRISFLAKHGVEQRVLESYTAQLYLRNQLNDIHKTLYHGDFNGEPNFKSIEMYSGLLATHTWVPKCYAFDDTDPPPNEILHARLRAKYWGAQVIVHRFYIRRILEINYAKRIKREEKAGKHRRLNVNGDVEKDELLYGDDDNDTKTAAGPASYAADETSPSAHRDANEATAGGDTPAQTSTTHPGGVDSPFSPKSMALARRGIQALVESTRAFHGLPDRRFIITNVFGTAHAQWGNLLILDSIQRDPVLGQYITEDLVNDLFRKTIAFFEVVAQPSSSLGYDLRILKGLYAMRMANPVYIEQAPSLPVAYGLPLQDAKAYMSSDPHLTMLGDNMNQMQELYPSVAEVPPATEATMPTVSSQPSSSYPPPRVSPLGPPPPPIPAAATTAAPTAAAAAVPTTGPPQYPSKYPDGSPMQISPMGGSPAQYTSPPGSLQRHTQTYVSPPAAALADGFSGGVGRGGGGDGGASSSNIPSPTQARLPGMQFGPPPAVKAPTTPNEPGFPHHLPPYERRPYE